MTPEPFTPEEVAALKKLARKQILKDEAIARECAEHPGVDKETLEILSDLIR